MWIVALSIARCWLCVICCSNEQGAVYSDCLWLSKSNFKPLLSSAEIKAVWLCRASESHSICSWCDMWIEHILQANNHPVNIRASVASAHFIYIYCIRCYDQFDSILNKSATNDTVKATHFLNKWLFLSLVSFGGTKGFMLFITWLIHNAGWMLLIVRRW